jgi:hypothetical protein
VNNDNELINSGFFSDANEQASTKSDDLYHSVLNHTVPSRRLVSSARSTGKLQAAGIRDIMQERDPRNVKCYGTKEHYIYRHRWHHMSNQGGILERAHAPSENGAALGKGVCDPNGGESDQAVSQSSAFSAKDVFPLLGGFDEKAETSSYLSILEKMDHFIFDARAGTWDKMDETTEYFLAPNPNSIATKLPAIQFFTQGRVQEQLLKLAIVPICQFRKKKAGLLGIPFGPLIANSDDGTYMPVALGTRFLSSHLYSILGLPHSKKQSSTWSSNSSRLNALIIRQPEKNFLYLPKVGQLSDEGEDSQSKLSGLAKPPSQSVSSKLQDGHRKIEPTSKLLMDALAEYDRIRAGKKRRGIFIYGEGGVGGALGPTAPSGNSQLGGNNAWFEYAQAIKSKRNLSLADAARLRRLVPVCLAGYYLPADRYDSDIGTEDDEQAAYLGLYFVEFHGYQYKCYTLKELTLISRFHKKRFGHFDEGLLRECLEPCLVWKLVPFVLPKICQT